MKVLQSEAELREIIHRPQQSVWDKATDRIDAKARRFIELSPFFLLATSSDDGTCDVSPRGDPPGSVLVLDEHTLAFGDRKGNRRLDCLCNILERRHVGMLFVIPGITETLRINGQARILAAAPYMTQLAVRNVVPPIAVEVHVEELFVHCTRAFVRSALWKTSSWPGKERFRGPRHPEPRAGREGGKGGAG
ncbi:pyridoxamine 5'-phosphate oxidase family protein [Spongiactinospora rosea]|uniref:Pyridoxamine 5'-phosphate oxidase family protein n=1 Tax=Spongiactinospora rosea TaxID=2248750 RepID=A0A366LQL3_9ACTN|nr:MSMEG_1061 family FMN-dependent PPOX-type flavoprotein [Spongiactinospora rosea]RBQ15823.1 pyridoxamine 5'-phosphate oxidase family protein [Spongiactinospora rosea]